MFSATSSPLTVVRGAPKEDLKEGPKPSRRTVILKGLAVGVISSAATARNRLRNGEVPQRLCAAPSSRPRSHVPTHCSFFARWSPAPPWVTGSPVAFLVATPWWPPDGCAAGLDFQWGAEAREGPQVVLLPSGTKGHMVNCGECHSGA